MLGYHANHLFINIFVFQPVFQKYIGEGNVQVPQHLKCPLSGKIFIDPVKAKGGHVYERRVIEEHLKT